ncbi:MAG: nucleotidyltransferase family protein [Pseudomonadota bacterium]
MAGSEHGDADYLRYSGLPEAEQRTVLMSFVQQEPTLMRVLEAARDLALPDCWLVSGAIYNMVWNRLTDRPTLNGVKDIDLFYFENGDRSYEAEDREIQRLDQHLGSIEPPVELRNQARVHLWYEDHFGEAYPPLASSREGIDRFASKTHAIGVRLKDDDSLTVYAPYGLDLIFSFRLVPNRLLNNKETHERKCKRAQTLWPELEIEHW